MKYSIDNRNLDGRLSTSSSINQFFFVVITTRVWNPQTCMQGFGSEFSKSDYMKSAPKSVIYCVQPYCILFYFFFFTVYHILLDPIASVDGPGKYNLIALLITADGDVSLCSSV